MVALGAIEADIVEASTFVLIGMEFTRTLAKAELLLGGLGLEKRVIKLDMVDGI